jgi:hypothetical protein
MSTLAVVALMLFGAFIGWQDYKTNFKRWKASLPTELRDVVEDALKKYPM